MEAATASFRYEDPRATKEDMESRFLVFLGDWRDSILTCLIITGRQLVLDVAMKKNLERVEKMLSEFGRAEDGGEMMGRRGESGKMAGGPAVRREPDDVEIE
jgi:hypothetical protein